MEKILLILIIFLIIFRQISTSEKFQDGQKILIKTKVTTEPIKYETTQYLRLFGLKVYLPKHPEVHYGDYIEVKGRVEKDELIDVRLISLEESESIVYQLRRKLVKFFQSSLPEPHSSLVAGIVLGSKASIPPSFWERLVKTGTAHVVVASGMNVTLVASFLISILIYLLPRRKAVILALIGVWFYAILSGFDAPIIRAAIMGSIAFGAVALGRLNLAWRGLVLSALIMLVVKPAWISDLGFILSFVATASLMLFERRVRKLVMRVPALFREGLSTSISAQIGVAPILYVTFGQFNLLSPVVNALVLWTIAPITVIGMIAAIISIIWEPLARLTILLVFPLTSWFIWIVEVLSKK